MARKGPKQTTSKGVSGPKNGAGKESDHNRRLRTKADKRVLERGRPGVELIPSEVWAIIVGYALHADFHSEFESKISHFRLLCRSMTGGLEEFIRQGMEDGMKQSGSLRLWVPGCTSLPIRLQKEAVIALSRAPKEFLWSVTTLERGMLSFAHYRRVERLSRIAIDIVQSTLLELKNVTRIDGPFLMNLHWPDTVIDLSHMTQLKVIGNDFLRGTILRGLVLPRSLEAIGNGFMAEGGGTTRLDLSHTAVKRIGSGFLLYTDLDEVQFPRTLESVGDEFLAWCLMEKVDLFDTELRTIGGNFLRGADLGVMLLPGTVSTIGNGFLHSARTKLLDLSHTAIADVGDEFLSKGAATDLILPKTVDSIGADFLLQGNVKKIDLSSTKVVSAGSSFLYGASFDELILPSNFEGEETGSLHLTSVRKIDLSRVGPDFKAWYFLEEEKVQELLLPMSFIGKWLKLCRKGRCKKAGVQFVAQVQSGKKRSTPRARRFGFPSSPHGTCCRRKRKFE